MAENSNLIFISYSSKDKRFVLKLKAELDRFGIHTWLDRHDLKDGENFEPQLEQALANCRALFCVLTPDSMASEWVRREVRSVHEQGKQVFVLEKEKTDIPDEVAFLAQIQRTPFTESFDEGIKRLLYALPLELKQTFFLAKLAELPTDRIPDPAPLPEPSNEIPYRPNPYFVGREAQMRKLAKLFKGEGEAAGKRAAIGQTAAATGIGGIGKTQLATEFAHRYGQYFLGGVFWFNFGEPESIPAQVAASGGKTGLDLDSAWDNLDQTTQIDRVRDAWQSELPRLLIFDNCEDHELLKDQLPPSGGCRVLVTSRRSRWPGTLGLHPIPIRTLPRPESIALLRNFRPDLAEDDPDLDAIAETLGDLPLALHMAGSYLDKYRFDISPAAYLEDLRRPDLLKSVSMTGGEDSPTEHDLHVGRTFALSLARLDPDTPDGQLGRALLARAAHFAPGVPIPRPLLKATLGEDLEATSAENALLRLLAAGLVEESETGEITIHRLVAAYATGTLADENALSNTENAVIAEAYRANMTGLPAEMLPVLPHLQFLVEHSVHREDEDSATLLNNYGYYLQMTGDYPAARPYYEQALATRRKVLGEEHPDTANSLNNLGGLLKATGDYPAARPYYEQALAIRRKALGEEHPDTATSLNNLGAMLQATGDYPAARTYFEQALAIRLKVLGEEHPDTATSLNNLGFLLQAMGDCSAALPYLKQALAITRRTLGEEHPDTASSLNNLGALLDSMGDYPAARPYYEQALAITRKVLGEQHPNTASSLNNLGALLQAMGDYSAARHYFEQALAICRKVLGEEHPDTALSLNNLGFLLHTMGDYVAARPYYEQALTIYKKVLGEQHPDTANSLNNLGFLLRATGDYPGARSYYEQALAIRRKILGEEHPDTANSLNNLGGLLYATGDYPAARTYFEQALAILEKVLGPDHPNTQVVRRNLESLLKEMGEQ